jgi:hypothetical protein
MWSQKDYDNSITLQVWQSYFENSSVHMDEHAGMNQLQGIEFDLLKNFLTQK